MTISAPSNLGPVLSAKNLYRFFHAGNEETQALRGVSLEVSPGDVVAISGPSGSGKSTLLACLAGLDEPDGGMVSVSGEPLSRRPEQDRAALRARSIGMLFQSNNLLDHLSVKGNIEFAQRLLGRPNRDRAARLLSDLDLTGRAAARPSELSGGESARAGLAVALANDPALLLADEPTGELDSATAALVIDLLLDRAISGTAVVIVTHSAAVARAATREIHLRDGQIDTSADNGERVLAQA